MTVCCDYLHGVVGLLKHVAEPDLRWQNNF